MESTSIQMYGVQVPEWYNGYVKALGDKEFLAVLKDQFKTTAAIFHNIPAHKWDFAYAPGKWTIKQLIIHMIDAERIFAYRALRFGRNDSTELAGFEEDEYAANCMSELRSPESIINEYLAVRASTLALFESFNDEVMMRKGIANGKEFSVGLLGVVIAGHQMHHMSILKERYLQS